MPLIPREEAASIQLVLDEADLLAGDPVCETLVHGVHPCENPATWRAVIQRTCGCGKPYSLKCASCRQRANDSLVAASPSDVVGACGFCHVGLVRLVRWERL